MKHKLIVIGWMSGKHAYLDVTMGEAIARYKEAEETDFVPAGAEEFEFDDEFRVYDAWEK